MSQQNQNDKWGNCRLAKTTLKKLDQLWRVRDSYDKIMLKLLTMVEGKGNVKK